MKIIGGKYKGKNFYMPEGIRPTQDIVRKALFDLLGRDLSGMTFLDLFAGSGSVGLEAVSRGAVQVTFVERVFRSCEIIRENLILLSAGADEGGRVPCEVMSGDAFAAVKLLARKGRKFDIIFADLSMPGENGLVLLEKSKKGFPDIPVVMITAFGDWDVYAKAIEKGAVKFVNKPVKMGEIVQIIKDVLG